MGSALRFPIIDTDIDTLTTEVRVMLATCISVRYQQKHLDKVLFKILTATASSLLWPYDFSKIYTFLNSG